jgi:hypothetical protein
MATARLATLADAVAAEINRGSFDIALTVQRRYQVVYELKELDQLQVAVVPRSWSIEAQTRGANQRTAEVQVGFQQRLDPDDVAAVDDLMALVGSVHHWLDRRRLVDDPDAAWLGAEQDPLFDPGVLREKRMFLSVLTLTYRLTDQS